MLTLMMLFWIGTKFDAPTWYWVCWWISVIFKVIQFGWGMFKAGTDIEETYRERLCIDRDGESCGYLAKA